MTCKQASKQASAEELDYRGATAPKKTTYEIILNKKYLFFQLKRFYIL